MPFLPDLPDNAHAVHVFARYPHIYKLYSMASLAIMRGPSPLSEAQREMIGAYVSALNGCDFCFGAHRETARLFGIDPEIFGALMVDLDSAPVSEAERALLLYARKLNDTPSRIIAADAQAVFDAGWDADALHSLVAVVCTFSFMNRFAPGLGIEAAAQDAAALGAERARTLWEPALPIPARAVADTPEKAYAMAPPDWSRIWGWDSER